MIDYILGFLAPGPFEILIVIILFVIPVVLIILFVKYLVRRNEEKRRLRLEVGKLSDELEKLRKQKDNEN